MLILLTFLIYTHILCSHSAEKKISLLTEHGHILSAVEVPIAPVGPVAMHGGIFLMVICWLSTKCVNHPDMTSVRNNDINAEPSLNDNSLYDGPALIITAEYFTHLRGTSETKEKTFLSVEKCEFI